MGRAVIGIPVVRMFLAKVFGNQNLDWLIEQFFSGIAEHAFRLRVDQQHPPGAIHNDHARRARLPADGGIFRPRGSHLYCSWFLVAGAKPGLQQVTIRILRETRDLAEISDKNR